ncbi:MAG: (Na+)-NQR maturation NqrM [Pseudomonadota bacterium]
MATFLFAFGFLLLIVLGMALGVILNGRTIKGSCGGLNAISGADRCAVCNKEIDPESPLRERLACPNLQEGGRGKAVGGEAKL